MVVAAKSTSDAYATNPFPPDPDSPQSTISTVEREIREAGGQATAIAVDTRDYDNVQKLVNETVKVVFPTWCFEQSLWGNRYMVIWI